MTNIGFIGLGEMGRRMAKNIQTSGVQLHLYNRTKTKAESLLQSGAIWHDSPKSLAQAADIVIAMVTNDQVSKEIWFHPEQGALTGLEQGKIAIECSTLSLDWIKKAAETFSVNGIEFIESPVVGTLPQAEDALLVPLISGNQKAVRSAQVVFDAISQKQIYLPDQGSATMMKLAINSLFAAQVAAFSEWYQALTQGGLSTSTIMECFPNLPITSPIMAMTLAQISEQNFASLFPIKLVEKDLRYGEMLVQKILGQSPITSQCKLLFEQAKNAGFQDLNISGVGRIFESTSK